MRDRLGLALIERPMVVAIIGIVAAIAPASEACFNADIFYSTGAFAQVPDGTQN